MNVKELKKLLEGAPDDATVVLHADDHEYRVAHCSLTTALKDFYRDIWHQDFGESITSELDYGKRRNVLIVE